MTPRLVIYATLASRGRGKWHAVDPHTGGPRCGVPLRRPHRAIAVTDGPWCGMCWGADEIVKPVDNLCGVAIQTLPNLERIEAAPEDADTSDRGLTHSPELTRKEAGMKPTQDTPPPSIELPSGHWERRGLVSVFVADDPERMKENKPGPIPRPESFKWSEDDLRAAHAHYVSGDRDAYIREGERVYQRLRKRAGRRTRQSARYPSRGVS